MHPPYSAVTVILLGLTGLFAVAAAGEWGTMLRKRPDGSPVATIRTAAAVTAAALAMLGLTLWWLAVVVLSEA